MILAFMVVYSMERAVDPRVNHDSEGGARNVTGVLRPIELLRAFLQPFGRHWIAQNLMAEFAIPSANCVVDRKGRRCSRHRRIHEGIRAANGMRGCGRGKRKGCGAASS